MSIESRSIFTIGHSTHKLEAFIALLKQHNITAVADVRSQPFSRWQPQFNRDALAASLKQEGIHYVPLGKELGARRDEKECYVNGQAVYEKTAGLPLYHKGINRILKGAKTQTIALMCAEKEPLDCHRTILVCRTLRPHNLTIHHILADGTLEAHADTEKRMIEMLKITPDLISQDFEEKDLIERAYTELGKQIAYRSTALEES